MIRHKTARVSAPEARRRLPAAQRRDLVLDAATRTFAEHGYEGASIAQIAERAGVVASVIYDHFGSKRELYLELLGSHARTLIESTIRPRPSGTVRELLEANLEAFYEFVEADPFVWRMLFREPPADPRVEAVHGEIQRRAKDGIAALIASVQPGEPLIAGVAREHTDGMLAEGITAINNALAGWWYEHRDVSRQQVMATARTLLWTGLGRFVERSEP